MITSDVKKYTSSSFQPASFVLELTSVDLWKPDLKAFETTVADDDDTLEDSEQEEYFERSSCYDQMNDLGLSWRDFA